MQLFHRDLGGPGRPPLVILHGLLGSSRNWQSAGADLAATFHVFALDLRNHGRSPQADLMTYDTMVDDVLDWLETQGLARATLLGHSLGGKVAMRLACQHPDRVNQLVVVDIAPRDYPAHADRAEFSAMHALPLDHLKTRGDAERFFEPRVPDWAMRKFLATNLDQAPDGQWRWMINLPGLTAALPELVKNPLEPGDRFAGPARFIVGGRSHYVRPEDEAAIRHHFPAAEIITMADAGHNPHMEKRAEFVRAVVGQS
jgi:esterase